MRKLFLFAIPVIALLLSGCSPQFNWREFTSKDASWQALFPDKPATASRAIDLDAMHTTMTMTAAEVDGILFAVGQAQASDERLPPRHSAPCRRHWSAISTGK